MKPENIQLVYFVHGHSGAKCVGIPTKLYADGTVDLVYWQGGPEGTPHAAEKVKYDLNGVKGDTFHFPHDIKEESK